MVEILFDQIWTQIPDPFRLRAHRDWIFAMVLKLKLLNDGVMIQNSLNYRQWVRSSILR